jgi:hypothetical protein
METQKLLLKRDNSGFLIHRSRMPNRKAKDAMRGANREAAQEREKSGLKASVTAEGEQLRTKAVENDLVGGPSILDSLPEMSVQERKLQEQNKGLLSPSGLLKGRVLSKNELLSRPKTQ